MKQDNVSEIKYLEGVLKHFEDMLGSLQGVNEMQEVMIKADGKYFSISSYEFTHVTVISAIEHCKENIVILKRKIEKLIEEQT